MRYYKLQNYVNIKLAFSDRSTITEDDKLRSVRGRIEDVKLKNPITFNAHLVTKAVIEIDHINHGLNRKTGSLNAKKRTNFSLTDIERFLTLLDGEYIMARNYKGRVSQFEVRIDCPVKGRFFGKEFIMIFDTDHDKPDQIHTITLYPGW